VGGGRGVGVGGVMEYVGEYSWGWLWDPRWGTGMGGVLRMGVLLSVEGVWREVRVWLLDLLMVL